MTELSPELADTILAACQAGAAEVGAALSRALDQKFQVQADAHHTLTADQWPDDCDGPGLAILLRVGDQAAVALLAESSGLLPAWYQAPDATGESKLTTLAQELSLLLLPETLLVENFQAQRVSSLSVALQRGGAIGELGHLPLDVTASERQGRLHLIWPLTKPDLALVDTTTSPPPKQVGSPFALPDPPQPVEDPARDPFAQLPHYTRSMLRIQVPIMVTLASKKQSIKNILELGPGSIIKFDKPCDETLELEVGGRAIAHGEAVKVGDKFGLRISSMILPSERFEKLQTPRRR